MSDDERWQRVNELFQAALDRGSPERDAFLDRACAGDEALRGEVESLLSSHQRAGSFLDAPAPQLALSEATTGDAEPQGERLAIGSRLGPYEVVALLGSGGMGEVYRARDPRLDRDVAIKVLSGGAADQGPRLAREARAAGALNHPNVLAVYDVGEEAGTPYVVCELLEGETLRDRLRRGAVPWRQSLELAGQVLAGMGAAHERGIVHRDLKPENLFLTHDGRLKILDFGLAKQRRPSAAGEHAATTQAGMIRGTIGYMSPEQLKSLPADHRSDIFAFGAILYELVAGRRAFAFGSPVETMSAILTQAPDLAGLSGAPGALAAVVERCLHRDPSERYGSAREVAAALEAVVLAGPRQAAVREAIAVLPFLNVGADPEQEYFCEGLAAELIHTLARLEGLRVASRTATFRFKGRGENVQLIGKELGVGRVLEGSVRRAGDRLRITVQLIDVASGYHVWSERYDRGVADVFALQDEIAARVVEALRLQLDPRLARMRRYTEDVEAYHLYLKGVHFWNKRHEGGLQKALYAFSQAIERDPLYAPAYAGLADSYAIVGLSVYDMLPAREAMPKAKAAARKALEIDPGLAAPHAALGWIRLHYDWEWAAAAADFAHALELDPGRATSHHWYGFYLSAMGRTQEALAESRRAFELEPLSLIINSQLCQPLYYARRFAEVGGAARKVLEMEPSFAIGHFWLGHAHAAERRYARAVAEYEAFAEHGGGGSLARALVGNTLARAGDRQGALAVLQELRALHTRRPVRAFLFALVHAGLGDADQAFAALETAFEERDDQLAYLGVEPLLDPLRRDPRFQDLLERLALPVSARRDAPGPAALEPTRRSVAVLPFRSLEGRGEDAHLGLGLTDATITELARSRSLVVRPTSAILRYQDRPADPQRAGRELGVDTVVDGSFQRSGARLRVTVQVVGTDDGRSLWAGKIDSSLEDVFQMQDEVSQGIARALDVELEPAGEGRLAGRSQAPDAAAYELYLEGKLHLFRETLDDMVAAVDCFEKARTAEPGFALACAGLADAYARIAFTYHPEGDWFRRAQAMCDKALELEPDLPEGRYVRARLRWSPQGGFDHAAAIRDLLTAIQGRPSLEEAYMRLGVVIHHVGLIDEARRLFDRALVISPDHVLAREHQGMCLLSQGRYEEALAVSQDTARRAPMPWIHYQVALCQLRLGRLDAAREIAATMCAQVPGEILSYPILGLTAALEGDAAAALDQVEKSARNKKSYGHYHHAQYDAACIHALLGRPDDAMTWLTDAARNGYPCVTFFESDDFLASLRGDERFLRLMRELREERAAYAALYARMGGGTAPS